MCIQWHSFFLRLLQAHAGLFLKPTSLTEFAESAMESTTRVAYQIAQGLVSKALTSTKSGSETTFRTIFDSMLSDWLVLVTSAQWPAAELMVRAIAHQLV